MSNPTEDNLVKAFEAVVSYIEKNPGRMDRGDADLVVRVYHAVQVERIADRLDDLAERLGGLMTVAAAAQAQGAKPNG